MAKAIPMANQLLRPPKAPMPMLKGLGGWESNDNYVGLFSRQLTFLIPKSLVLLS